jgi:hypothetical protein
MKKITYLLLAASLFAASCKKDKKETPAPTPQPEVHAAKVKFTNACLNAGTQAIKINDTTLNAVAGVDFLGSTGYINTDYGNNVKIAFVYPSTGTVLQETTGPLADGGTYSAFIGGEVPNMLSMVVVSDNLNAPASGKSKVRFINLSRDNYDLDFYVGGPKLDSAVSFGDHTPFYEVNAGTMNVIAQDPDFVGYQRTLNGQVFEAGKIYTIMFSGKNGATGDADLKLTVVQHN